nr:complement factor H-like [Penaeus vannamei]
MRVYMCGFQSPCQPRPRLQPLPPPSPHSCGAMNSSLALIRDRSDLEGADQETFYYTGHTFRGDPESRPSIPSLADLNCTDDCELTPGHECVVVSGQGTYRFQNCSDGLTKYSCMYPAYCPVGYTLHLGLCYKVIPAASTFHDSYESCMKEGSDLAVPENVNDLQFLTDLVMKTEQKPIEEPVKVMLGIACPSPWQYSMDIPGYQYCQSLHSSLDILPEGEFSVNPSERQTKAKYAVCKHQGILDCWSAPESPRKHTTLSWNNSMDYETPAIYQCDEGYYFKGATARRKKTVWCNGQFSNWYPTVASCVIVGCHKDPPDTPKSLTRTLSENYKSDNGTVTYTCPARMVTLKNATNQTVTCRKLRTRYRFSPLRVSDCPACAGKPEVANAWTTWDNETMYEVGSAVVAMCRRDHYVRWRERKQKVQCTESGWQEVPGCVLMRSCDGELPDSDLEPVLSHEFPREGTWATYVCPPTMGSSEDGAEEEVIRCTETPEGMQLLPEVTHPCWRCMAEPTIPNAQTDWQGSVHYLVNSSVTATCSPGRFHAEGKSRLVTCLSTGWEAADGCEPGCSSEPPEGEGDVTREEFTDRRVGARVYYHCSSENFFKSFGYRATYKTAVECQEDGEWHLTDAELKCETVVWQEPPSLNGTVSNLPNWSIFLGTTIEYRCREGLFSVTGAASTNATAILGGWTDFDPDFRCVPACLKEPEVRNAELAWDSDALYLLDAHVTATCNEGHLSDGGEASRVVTCTAYGWEAISGCYVACTAAPPPAGENMVMGQYNFTGVGASVQYECAQDFYVKRQGEPVSNTSAVCGEDLTWHLSHGSLDCDMPLWIDPPPPLEGVTLQGLQPPFYAGLSYNMTCAEGLSSATGVAFTTVVIASEGWCIRTQTSFALLRASQNRTCKTP